MRQPNSINEEEVRRLYCEEKLSAGLIARQLKVRQGRVSYILKQEGIFRSPSQATKLAFETGRLTPMIGNKHPLWKGGKIETSGGYIMIRAPKHPRASMGGGKYVMEHILVWEKVHDTPLPPGWVVHHLNGITTDNRPCNLVALPGKKHYLVLQAKGKRIRELEAEVKLLDKALENGQMVIRVSEN